MYDVVYAQKEKRNLRARVKLAVLRTPYAVTSGKYVSDLPMTSRLSESRSFIEIF